MASTFELYRDVAGQNDKGTTMERAEAQARIQAAMEILRIRGWTVEQRNRLVDGLQREEAVEIAERAANHLPVCS